MPVINHLDNLSTNLSSGTSVGATTSPLNTVPSISAPFYMAWDRTNINGHFEVKQVTSKNATNVNHAALTYAHTTDEEVGCVTPAEELDALSTAVFSTIPSGWISYSTVIPTRASADDPTYVLTFAGVDLTSTMSVGMKVKWTQNSTVRYGIITAIAFSTNTTLTLYGGTDYDVDDTATYAISAFNYSTQKAPLGFPLDPTKWTVKLSNGTQYSQASPVQNTWYNLNAALTITLPIGAWNVDFQCVSRANKNSTSSGVIQTTLSTGTNTESDSELTAMGFVSATGSTAVALYATHFREKQIIVATKTPYYLNVRTQDTGVATITIEGSAYGMTVIRAVCAYL